MEGFGAFGNVSRNRDRRGRHPLFECEMISSTSFSLSARKRGFSESIMELEADDQARQSFLKMDAPAMPWGRPIEVRERALGMTGGQGEINQRLKGIADALQARDG